MSDAWRGGEPTIEVTVKIRIHENRASLILAIPQSALFIRIPPRFEESGSIEKSDLIHLRTHRGPLEAGEQGAGKCIEAVLPGGIPCGGLDIAQGCDKPPFFYLISMLF